MQIVRLRFLFFALAAVIFPGLLFADDAAKLKERLHTAAAVSALDAGDIKPWHLLMSFQLMDEKGGVRESGTIEEWWAAPNLHKTVYTSPSYTNTEIKNDQGLYWIHPKLYPPEVIESALSQVLHPIPDKIEIDEAQPELRVQTLGIVPLDCVMLDLPTRYITPPLLGLFPTYCLDRDKDALRASLLYGTTTILRTRIGTFQGKSVAVDHEIVTNGVPVLKAHVEKLGTATVPSEMFLTSPEYTLLEEKPTTLPYAVIAGSQLTRVTPNYPQRAKTLRISGAVEFNAVIGVDGHIHHLKLVSSPDPELAVEAYRAIRQWTYTPYLLNGRPVTVKTTITVNFNL